MSPPTGEMSISVRYVECDPMGNAHHSAYPVWFEMARTELLRADGISYQSIEEEGCFLAVLEIGIKYRRRILYDQIIRITTRLVECSRVRVRHEYDIRNGDDLITTTGYSVLACIDGKGRAKAIPEVLRRHAEGTLVELPVS